MARFLGARDLGLTTDWRFRFTGMGEQTLPTPGVLYLDVGGRIAPGIIDHHGGEVAGSCSASLVLRHREYAYNHLLGPWLERHADGRLPAGTHWTPTLVLHEHPDFDALVASHLVIRLIEEGDFPDYADALAHYAREVDQGRFVLRPEDPGALRAIHMAHLGIQNARGAEGGPPSSETQLTRGLALLDSVLPRIAAAMKPGERWRMSHFLPGSTGVDSWVQEAQFDDVRRLLDDEPVTYAQDRGDAEILENVLLPGVDGGEPIRVRAFVASRPTRSILNKYWVRAEGFPFFICPYGESRELPDRSGTAAPSYPRVVLSVDPTWAAEEGRKPDLRGLGFALEKAEAEARRALHNGVDDRPGPARYAGGYCDNSDPWYDGRAHEYTIVDAPISGSVIAYRDLVQIATGGQFWMIPVVHGAASLVWVLRDAAAPADLKLDLGSFDQMADVLVPFRTESRESPDPVGAGIPSRPHFRASSRIRHFPPGWNRAFRIVDIEATERATLEDFVQAVKVPEERPAYAIIRTQLDTRSASPKLIGRLLNELGGGDLVPVESLGGDGELVLFNSRTLVFSQERGSKAGADPDREIMLYVAFLYEALIDFSHKISELLPASGSRLSPGDTRALRETFLRFQTRYYQPEASRSARGRLLFRHLSDSLGIEALYSEVRSELDRLADLENQIAAERQAKGERLIGATLYFLSVAGLYQTILAFVAWGEHPIREWLWAPPILLIAVAIYLLFLRLAK